MNVVDRLVRDIDVIKTGAAVNFVSNWIFYLFIAILLSNVLLLLNYLLFGIDLCRLFLPVYETLGFPLFQRGVGPKNQHPFFCSFDVVTRPVFFLYAALFCVLAILLFVSNILDGWRKSLQILIFFQMWGIAGIIFPYSDILYTGFYHGNYLVASIEFVGESILVPFVLMVLCFVLRTGNQFTVKAR